MFNQFYKGKRVLLTGHTGFKGGWLSLWLAELGAELHGLSLEPEASPTLHELISPGRFSGSRVCDIRDSNALKSAIDEIQPEVIFHMAAQAIVRKSYQDPLETFASNATGTANLLDAVRTARVNCTTIIITSDKCYENREWEFAYRENDSLGGHDVYSMSKAATELVAQSWYRSFFADDPALGAVVTARAGNVIGGGDYAADRIIPDCIRALANGQPVLVRNPAAVRPWQHVLECLSGYLCLAERVALDGKSSRVVSPFNFGPDSGALQPVGRLVAEVLRSWPGEWTDVSDPDSPHEAGMLTLCIDKAAALLGWRPVWSFERDVRATVEWYRHRHRNDDDGMEKFTVRQIHEYQADAAAAGLSWAV